MIPGFFILGNPRSGTSLLRNVLNAHPRLSVPPECGFLLWLWPRFRDVLWDSATRDRFIAEVMASKKFETWELEDAILRDVVHAAEIDNYAAAGTAVYMAYARSRDKNVSLWGDKNNYYVHHLTELLDLLPGARIIHIVRDPRDVACSYLELGKRGISSKYVPVLPQEPSAVAAEWQANNDRIVTCKETPGGYLCVRYEDLVGAFHATTAALFDFLGMDMPAGFDGRAHIDGLDEPAEFLQWKAKVTGPVDSASVGRYRTDLPAEAVATIEQVAGSGMRAFGYIRSAHG